MSILDQNFIHCQNEQKNILEFIQISRLDIWNFNEANRTQLQWFNKSCLSNILQLLSVHLPHQSKQFGFEKRGTRIARVPPLNK